MNWQREEPSTAVVALVLVRFGDDLRLSRELCRWNTSIKRWMGITSGLLLRGFPVAWAHEADLFNSFLEAQNESQA
jgi:hypothetical protein